MPRLNLRIFAQVRGRPQVTRPEVPFDAAGTKRAPECNPGARPISVTD